MLMCGYQAILIDRHLAEQLAMSPDTLCFLLKGHGYARLGTGKVASFVVCAQSCWPYTDCKA
jgi:hypothetical protein